MGVKHATIKTDSTLVVNQIKGIHKCKNFLLKELMKICHNLVFNFTALSINYHAR
jgi:ribonuclease HI